MAPKTSFTPNIQDPGCDMIVCIRQPGDPSPLTGRYRYEYDVLPHGSSLVRGKFTLLHQADFAVDAKGRVWKNRTGSQRVDVNELHHDEGKREIQAALIWYENFYGKEDPV